MQLQKWLAVFQRASRWVCQPDTFWAVAKEGTVTLERRVLEALSYGIAARSSTPRKLIQNDTGEPIPVRFPAWIGSTPNYPAYGSVSPSGYFSLGNWASTASRRFTRPPDHCFQRAVRDPAKRNLYFPLLGVKVGEIGS